MKKRAKNKTCSFLGKEKKIAGGETKKKTDLGFILLRMRIIELCCSIGDRSDPARHFNSLLQPLLCVAKPVSAPGILTRLVFSPLQGARAKMAQLFGGIFRPTN